MVTSSSLGAVRLVLYSTFHFRGLGHLPSLLAPALSRQKGWYCPYPLVDKHLIWFGLCPGHQGCGPVHANHLGFCCLALDVFDSFSLKPNSFTSYPTSTQGLIHSPCVRWAWNKNNQCGSTLQQVWCEGVYFLPHLRHTLYLQSDLPVASLTKSPPVYASDIAITGLS